MKIQSRYEWLDVAKGITILLMVVGHTSIPAPINRFIFAFHMPLFFIASGFCTNWDKLSFHQFVLHKGKVLLIPFIVYSTLVLAIGVSTGQMSLPEVLKGGWASCSYPLWFIPILFSGLMLSKAIMSIRSAKLRISTWLSMAVIGSVLCNQKVFLPWILSPAFYASFLLIAGTYARHIKDSIFEPKSWQIALSFVVTAVISCFCRLDMAWNVINPIALITVGAFSGTYMTFSLSALISERKNIVEKFFIFWGKETYIVLAFASIIISTINLYITESAVVRYLIGFCILFILIYAKNYFSENYRYKHLQKRIKIES